MNESEKTATCNGSDVKRLVRCPGCGKPNDDNWPIMVGQVCMLGGCQECWEADSDAAWWNAVDSIML